MKEAYYFSHDYNARSDEKIKLLIRKHGMCGYGIFWAIVEDLYNNANALRTDYDGIAYDLRTDSNLVKSVINDFGLFVFEDDVFGSTSVEVRLQIRDEKSKKQSKNANKRWEKYRIEKEKNATALKNDATALPPKCEGNPLKDSKGKDINESKENKGIAAKAAELEKKKTDFLHSLTPFSQKHNGIYPPEMLKNFFDYWTEKNPSGTLMRFQQQKTWETHLRLATWARKDKIQSNGTTQNNYSNGNGIAKKGTSDARIERAKSW